MLVLYGRNRFNVAPSSLSSLPGCFRLIGPKALSSMTSLHILLTSEIAWEFDVFIPSEELALSAWEATCEYLSQHLVPGQVHFAFTYSMGDSRRATQLAASLEILPLMRSCTISFDGLLDLRSLARSLSMKLSGCQPEPSAPFRFFDLPGEIRTLILEQTDLVARRNRCQWSQDGFEFVDGSLLGLINYCCNNCTDTLASCCCLTRPAAYSQSCDCYTGPFDLLTVSKQMTSEAYKVLGSNNRFAFMGILAYTRDRLRSLSKPISENLKAIHIHISLEELIKWSEANFEEWHALLDYIKGNIHLERLIFSLSIGTKGDRLLRFQRESIQKTNKALDIVITLKGLKNYFVSVPFFPAMEEPAEKGVMGIDYDSRAAGKKRYNMNDVIDEPL